LRIACLLVPDLPLHAELRANPELAAQPLVITSDPSTRAEILTASPRALAQGVHPGQSLPQARAVARDLVVRITSPVLERAARETLLDVALSLAPRAELAARASGVFATEAAVYVDASGIDALHGGERAFASLLHARAERAGLPGFVALASSRNIARLAARHLAHRPRTSSGHAIPPPNHREADRKAIQDEATHILPPGEELAFLSPLPIDLLDPDDRTAEALTRFGIHRIHDLLRLPHRDLAARVGTKVLALVRRARGEDVECPLPEPKNHCLEEGLDLEAPIASLEPLAFVFRGLVSRLLERLRMRSLGCAELRLEMQLEDGRRESRRIGLARATQNERVVLRLLRLAIESKPPETAVETVVLRSEGVPLRREQLDFFAPRGPSPNELDQTLAELSALCGPERVGAPALLDDHRPDAFELRPFTPKPLSSSLKQGGTQRSSRRLPARARPAPRAKFPANPESNSDRPRVPRRSPRLTLRALRPPLHAEVRVERGKPAFIRSAVSQGEVISSAGPWRTTGHWWLKSAHFAIDHYDIQMSDGTVLRLCFDWKTKWWQIDGLYD